MSLIGLIQTRGQRATVQRPVYRTDTVGTKKKTFVHNGFLKVFVASRAANEVWDGDRQMMNEVVTLYVEGGSDVLVTDRVKLGNTVFEITGMRTPGHRKQGDRHFYHILDAVSNEAI